MKPKDLSRTQKQLAIIFAGIVFGIAVLMEGVFFSIRYYQINEIDERQFQEAVDNFKQNAKEDPVFLVRFISDSFNSPRYIKRKGGDLGMGGPFRFVDFLLFDGDGNLVGANLREDLTLDDIEEIHLRSREKAKVSPDFSWEDDGFYYASIDLGTVSANLSSIIFLKHQSYDLEKYFEDVFFFLIFTLIFSIGFYFIGFYFVKKVLKPVEESLEDMTDFIHHASHELKTPLSVMSSNLQLIKLTKSYDEDLVVNSISEIGKMDELIVALTNLSNISSHSHIQLLHIGDEIQQILTERSSLIQQYGITVNFDNKKPFSLQANKEYFYILFTNLLKNALKYNLSEQGKISIVLDKNTLSISNTGAGIPKEELPKIFERFYKTEKSRNTEGYGIGLALVKKIAGIYNWKLDVESVVSGETTFRIRF